MVCSSIPPHANRAVVIGGSIAGLLAARVLLNHFEQVVLLERDTLEQAVSDACRPGVPQAQHVHVLLTKGQQLLEQLFPGIAEELGAAGAPTIDWVADWMIFGLGGWNPRYASPLVGSACSRNLLEARIRQRLLAHPGFIAIEGVQVDGLLHEASQTVTGVKLHQRNDPSEIETLTAALVVDASGRNSALPEWLKTLGYAAPQETTLNSFLGYGSRWYEVPPDLQADWKGITVFAVPGQNKRGGVLYPIEGNRWIVTLAGVGRDYPPSNDPGFLEFARSLRHPILYDVLKQAQPISPIYSYRRTENRLRHYDRISLPEGVVVLGDAVCAFNPVYGQGMTTAALGAIALDRCLAQGNQRGLTKQFQKQLAKVVATPWLMATGEDSRWSTTEGARPTLVTRSMQAYIDRVLLIGVHNERVFRAFSEVMHMIKPPAALFHPAVVFAVLQSLWSSQNYDYDAVSQP